MSTTTIRIEDELKARIAVAAQHAGKTAHAFILDAISQTWPKRWNKWSWTTPFMQ